MANPLPLKEMSIEEKLRAMESLWDDLCGRAGSMSSPAWRSGTGKSSPGIGQPQG